MKILDKKNGKTTTLTIGDTRYLNKTMEVLINANVTIPEPSDLVCENFFFMIIAGIINGIKPGDYYKMSYELSLVDYAKQYIYSGGLGGLVTEEITERVLNKLAQNNTLNEAI